MFVSNQPKRKRKEEKIETVPRLSNNKIYHNKNWNMKARSKKLQNKQNGQTKTNRVSTAQYE